MGSIKEYVQRQWKKILQGRVSLEDFVFRKEVKLGSYKSAKSLPPAALVATKMMKKDPRAEPQ
jgi:DNA polymerase zeta